MEHWSFRTAYEIFLRAAKIYWNAFTGFDYGLCGLINAAYDLGYNADDVREAFAKVGVFCGEYCDLIYLFNVDLIIVWSQWSREVTAMYSLS